MNEKPTVYLYKPFGQKYDITKACDGIQWSGDYQQAARKIDLEMLYAVHDRNQPTVIPETGDFVALYADNKEVFRGVVWNRDLSSNSQFIKITAFDALIYLTKSTTSRNFKAITPAAATQNVCIELEVPTGNLVAPNVKYSDCAMGKSPYEIIMAGYSEASKVTGKKYIPRMELGKLTVIEKGAYVVKETLSDTYNIQNAQHAESLDAMVNKVVIYDDKGNIVDKVENSGWVDLYGIIQNAVQIDKEKDTMAIARKALKPMERKCSIEALGNIEAITGNAVKVKANHSDVNGLFFIDGDTHSWKGGLYTMTLTLNFENLMDEKETAQDSSDSSSSSGDGGSAGTWQKYYPAVGPNGGYGTDDVK